MRSLILWLAVCGGLYQVTAQSNYTTPVFDDIKTATYTYTVGYELDLYLAVDDTTTARPLIIYVHGGGFRSGKRNEPNLVEFAHRLARYGYVIASIAYPLPQKDRGFGCDIPQTEKAAAVELVGQYINYSRDYLLNNAEHFKINRDKVVLIGSSAGAESVLHAVYWDACATNSYSPPYAGLVSMAGAIMDVNWIQQNNAIPMLLFHGTCDELVPYGSAPHHYCDPDQPGYWFLHGGHSIAKRAEELRQGYFLYTDCGGGHEWHDKAFIHAFQEIVDFLHHDVMLRKKRQMHQIVESDKSCSELPAHDCE